MNVAPAERPDSLFLVAVVFYGIALLALVGTAVAWSNGVFHVDLTFLVFFAVRGLLRGSGRWRIFLVVVAWLYVCSNALDLWLCIANESRLAEISGFTLKADSPLIAILHIAALTMWLSVAFSLHGSNSRNWCDRRKEQPKDVRSSQKTSERPKDVRS